MECNSVSVNTAPLVISQLFLFVIPVAAMCCGSWPDRSPEPNCCVDHTQRKHHQHGSVPFWQTSKLKDAAAKMVDTLSLAVDADGDGVTDDVEDGWVAQSATGARAGKRSFRGVL